MMKKFLAVIGLVFTFFFPSLLTFFVQDDFWLLSISHIKTAGDFFNFFIPLSDAVWYRPLSSQVFFFIGRTVFGLNPLPYHVVVLITHIGTSFILYKWIKKMTNNEQVSMFSALVYGTHQVHTISLSWLAAYSFVLGPFFLALTLFFFTSKKYVLAFFAYLLGLLSSEVLIITPLILLLYFLIYKKNTSIKFVLLFIFSAVLLVLLRFYFFPSQQNTPLYSVTFSSHIFETIKFYFLRLIGVPLFINGMDPGLKLFVSGLSVILFVGTLIGFVRNRSRVSKQVVLWFGIYLLAIAPFLLLPFHVSPHYLSFALIGAAPLFSYYLLLASSIRLKKAYLMIAIGSFLLLNFAGTQWVYQTHWVFRRADIAKQLILHKNFIYPPGSEEYFSLGANAASKVFER